MHEGGCLARNLGTASLLTINSDDLWHCLVCDNAPLQKLMHQQIKEEPAKPKEDPDVSVLRWIVDLEFAPTECSEEECSLCLEEMKFGVVKLEGEKEEWVMKTACGHHFHRSCLHKWLHKCSPQDRSCPMCRAGM